MNNETRVSDPASQYDKVEIRNLALAIAIEKESKKTVTLGKAKRPVMGDVISTQLQQGMIILTDEAKKQKNHNSEEMIKD